jgi:serine/threonine-protein kinase
MLAAGTTLGPYKILAPLGAGGMGEVYLAHDPRLDRNVALKCLASHFGVDEESRARFAREIRIIARLDHPNIVTLHEAGEFEGRPYLVMQFVDGPSLAKFSRGRRLTIETVLDLGVQLCSGLQAAHDQGVIHRDVKPSNILLDSQLRARLVDFGLARLVGGTNVTTTGTLCGTLGYVPPEVVLGEAADPGSDIFSLGVVLYELLTGRLPFAVTSTAAHLYAVVNEQPEPLTRHRGDAPPGLEAALERALARDRALRYATAAEFGADLNALSRQPGRLAGAVPRRPSIAVLPFEDMSPDHDQEYFCDGIAEELINVLTRIEGLRVIARTSAFAFKGSPTDAREIGRRLGVQALLQGSVRKAGQRVRVGVQLVQAEDGSHLWAERFDRELVDIFAIQDEVCLSIAARLRVTLLEDEKTRLVRHRTHDADAYTLYLKARFLFNQRQEASLQKSLEYYHQAIEADPRFALAYAGLAEACEMLGAMRLLPLEVAYAEARRAAVTAVELDDTLAEAHVALAGIRMFCDWNWNDAGQEFERALAINPACAEAHHMVAHWHEAMGRFDRALAEMDRALELEPVAPGIHSCLAQILFHGRRYDEAARQCGVTLEITPSFTGVYGWLGMAHIQGGRVDVGLATLEEGLRLRPGDPRLEALLGFACALAGREDGARAGLERLRAMSSRRYVDPYFMVWPHAALGQADAAFDWLIRARDEHSQWLYVLKVDPLLDGLRPDGRFAELLEDLHLPA